MILKNYTTFLFILTIAFSLKTFAQEKQDNRSSKEKWDLVLAEGRVTDINKDLREVTVMGPKGNLLTMEVNDAVERFNEINVNDLISFEYYTYILAEFRQPTSEEIEEPLVILAEAGKAPENMDPSAAVGALVKAVVTIEVINQPEMIVTVKGPRGNYVSINMEDESLIKELHVGQVVILTYAEAIALSLEKIN
jgi:hypothetical protein